MRVFEGIADDLLGAGQAQDLEALVHIGGLAMLDTGIEVLLVLAHHHHIHVRMHRSHEGVITAAGSHVGEEAEGLSDRNVQALVPAALRRGDGTFEEDGVAAQGVPRLSRDAATVAAEVDLLAHIDVLVGEVAVRGFEDAENGIGDLGPDAIPLGNGDGMLHFSFMGCAWSR